MDWNMRLHAISIQLLLIASAVQGVTPDPQNLASQKAFYLLCTHLVFPDSCGTQDDCSDEVSGSIWRGVGSLFLRRRDRAPNPTLLLVESVAVLRELDTLRLTPLSCRLEPIDHLFEHLCRLTC
jgi:hypothetical protein